MIKNLPQGWRVEKLGNLCDIATGKKDANFGTLDGQYLFFTCAAKPIRSNSYSFDGESIILAGNGANVGLVLYYDGKFEAYQRTYVLNSFTENSRYIYYNLQKYWIFHNSGKQFGSATNYIKMENITDYPIVIPPLPQQEKIVKVLDNSSSLVEQQKQLIEKYDVFLKSKFIEMFGTLKDNIYCFDVEPISKFGKIITGNTPSRDTPDYYNENFIEWIKTDNILENKQYVSTAKEYLSELGAKKGRTLEKDGLLITCIAGSLRSIGNVALTDRKISFNQQINAIQPFKNINSLFLYWLIKLNISYIQSFATSSMKKIITKGEFENIKFLKPPLDLQNEFALLASKIQAIKEKETLKLNHLETLHASLMDKAFKGEIV
jgi:type I restriction enzyme S subunit